jgi:hypothetical protein
VWFFLFPLAKSFLDLRLFQRQLVGHVVFVNVADVLHGFLPYILRHHQFDIPEPLISVQALASRLLPQAQNSARARIVDAKTINVLFVASRLSSRK